MYRWDNDDVPRRAEGMSCGERVATSECNVRATLISHYGCTEASFPVYECHSGENLRILVELLTLYAGS